jgi:hypothetical protein
MSSWATSEKYTGLLSGFVSSIAICGLSSHGFFGVITVDAIFQSKIFAGLPPLSYIIQLLGTFGGTAAFIQFT